jgi:hypothetical protein
MVLCSLPLPTGRILPARFAGARALKNRIYHSGPSRCNKYAALCAKREEFAQLTMAPGLINGGQAPPRSPRAFHFCNVPLPENDWATLPVDIK